MEGWNTFKITAASLVLVVMGTILGMTIMWSGPRIVVEVTVGAVSTSEGVDKGTATLEASPFADGSPSASQTPSALEGTPYYYDRVDTVGMYEDPAPTATVVLDYCTEENGGEECWPYATLTPGPTQTPTPRPTATPRPTQTPIPVCQPEDWGEANLSSCINPTMTPTMVVFEAAVEYAPTNAALPDVPPTPIRAHD